MELASAAVKMAKLQSIVMEIFSLYCIACLAEIFVSAYLIRCTVSPVSLVSVCSIQAVGLVGYVIGCDWNFSEFVGGWQG